MPPIDWSHVAARLVHILAAVFAVGGAVFIRVVLMPSARVLPDEAHAQLRDAVRRRWAMTFGIAIFLLFITGLFNYMAVALPQHRGQSAYHAIFGVKFILAFVVFFIGSALAGRATAFEAMRRSAATWLTLNILLAFAVIGLACVLRYFPTAAH